MNPVSLTTGNLGYFLLLIGSVTSRRSTGSACRRWGLLLLRDKIGKERRPLSWVAGSQAVEQPAPPCMRDRKRQERMKATVLPSPDEVK